MTGGALSVVQSLWGLAAMLIAMLPAMPTSLQVVRRQNQLTFDSRHNSTTSASGLQMTRRNERLRCLKTLYGWYLKMSTERKQALRLLAGLRRAHSAIRLGLAEDFRTYESQSNGLNSAGRQLKPNDTVLVCGHPDDDLNARSGLILKIRRNWKNGDEAIVSFEDRIQKKYWRSESKSLSEKRFNDRHMTIQTKYLLKKVPNDNIRYWRKKFRRELKEMRRQGFTEDVKNIQALRSIAEKALAKEIPSKIKPAGVNLPSRKILKSLTDGIRKESRLSQLLMESWVNLTVSNTGFHKTILSGLASL